MRLCLKKKKNVNVYHMRMYLCFSRVAYLLSKNFSKADVAQMVRKAPFLLNFSVERLDNRLGFFQKELELSVKKVKKRREFVYFHVWYILVADKSHVPNRCPAHVNHIHFWYFLYKNELSC